MKLEMPYLLELYEKKYNMDVEEYLNFYNKENFLPKEFDEILRKNIFD